MSKSRSQQRRTRLFFIPFEKNKAYEDLMKQAESIVSPSSVEEPVLPDPVSERPAATQPRRPPTVPPLQEETEPCAEEDTSKPEPPPPPVIKPPTLVKALRIKRRIPFGDDLDDPSMNPDDSN